MLVQLLATAGQIEPAGAGVVLVQIVAAVGRQGDGVGHVVTQRVVAGPGGAGGCVPRLAGSPYFEFIEGLFQCLFQHDVDGACHRPCAIFGRGRAHHLNALHLVGREVVQ